MSIKAVDKIERVADMRRMATGVAAVLPLGLLFVLRAVASATTTSVTFAGQELQWGCAFKQAFGIPCPTCGMTRSVLLALHGHLGEALEMNPGGPLLILGALLLSAAMFYLTLYGRGRDASFETAPRRVVIGASVYGGLMFAVLTMNWLCVIA